MIPLAVFMDQRSGISIWPSCSLRFIVSPSRSVSLWYSKVPTSPRAHILVCWMSYELVWHLPHGSCISVWAMTSILQDRNAFPFRIWSIVLVTCCISRINGFRGHFLSMEAPPIYDSISSSMVQPRLASMMTRLPKLLVSYKALVTCVLLH